LENEIAAIIRDMNAQASVHLIIMPKKGIERIDVAQHRDAELFEEFLIVARDFVKSLKADSRNGR
jgi:diadenosine tetraphosphate (Ap4A) HIT family hydrolase